MGQVVAPSVLAGLQGQNIIDAAYPIINQGVQSIIILLVFEILSYIYYF